MKKSLTLFFVIVSSTVLFGQKKGAAFNDSLINVLPKIKQDTDKVSILNILCRNFLVSEKLDDARSYGAKALSIARHLNFRIAKIQMCISYQNIGSTYFYDSQFEDALLYYDSLLMKSKEINYKKGMADGYNNVGNIYKDSRRFAFAEKYYDSSLAIKIELHDSIGIGKTYYNLGNVHSKQGHYPLALKNFSLSLQYRTAIKDSMGIAECYENIGLVNNAFGSYPEAVKNELAALRVFEKICDTTKKRDQLKKASIFGDLGIVYENISDFQEALKYHCEALRIESKYHYKDGVALDYTNIGNIYLDLENYDDAIKYHLLALEMGKDIPDTGLIADAYSNLGQIMYHKGDYQDAIAYHDTALELRRMIQDTSGISISFGNLGETYLALKNFPFARIFLDSSNDLSKYIGRKEALVDNYLELSEVDSAEGNYKMALDDYKLHTQYNDSIRNQKNTVNIVSARMQYFFEKQQDSINLIAEEREIELHKEMQLKALRYEYEKKQAAAKSEKEKQELKFEEALKENRLIYEASKRQDSLKVENDKELTQKDLQHKLALAIAYEKNKRQRIYYLVGAGLLLIVSLTGFRIYRDKKLKIERGQLTDLARAKIHDIRSNYNDFYLLVKEKNPKLENYIDNSSAYLKVFLRSWNDAHWTIADEMRLLTAFYNAEITIKKTVEILPNFNGLVCSQTKVDFLLDSVS